jgi:hypothetical protein
VKCIGASSSALLSLLHVVPEAVLLFEKVFYFYEKSNPGKKNVATAQRIVPVT